jgi:hypothetical protein
VLAEDSGIRVVEDKFMNIAVCRALKTQSWKDLYHAAICESNLNKRPGCIDDAEAALVIRARELYYAVDDELEEKQSLDDAMSILHALRRSLKRRPPAAQSKRNLDYLKSA